MIARVLRRFAGSRGTRYTRGMRLDVRLVLPFALLIPCVSLACVERQESPQQQAAPQAQPQPEPAQTSVGPKSKFQGIPIKKGVGMPGMGVGQGPTATPPPPAESSAPPAPSASASK